MFGGSTWILVNSTRLSFPAFHLKIVLMLSESFVAYLEKTLVKRQNIGQSRESRQPLDES